MDNEILDMNINDILSDEEQQELLDSEPPAEYMGQDGTLHTFENDHKDSYVELFSNINKEENNPYKDEDDIF